MKRAYNMSQWQSDFARAFAAAIPLEAQSTQARGALLASSNDEPERRTFALIEAEANAEARAIVRGVTPQRLRQFEDARERPTHRCLLCGTEYFSPGECDWCPVQLTPIQRGPLSEAQLAQADLENHHLKVSGEFERRREHSALQLQANMPKWGL